MIQFSTSFLIATGLWLFMASPAFGQKLSAQMMDVKAWQGKLKIKGSSSGAISGPAGFSNQENYVVSWDVEATVTLDQQVPSGRYWSGKIAGKGTISHSLTTRMSDGCLRIDEIQGSGEPKGDGGAPVVMLFAGSNDTWAFFTNAVIVGRSTTRFQGTGPSCSGSAGGDDVPITFWPDAIDRDKQFAIQNPLSLSHTGDYEMPFPLPSINAILGGGSPKPKVNVSLEFTPLVKDELVLEISAGQYESWLPAAAHSGAPGGTIRPGEEIVFTAELKMKNGGTLSERATHFTWELSDVSKEPGIALNWPPNGRNYTEPDLKFDPYDNQVSKDEQRQKLETKPGEYASDKARVEPFDWGAWGVLKVKAHFASRDPVEGKLKGTEETEVRLPKRSRSSYIADYWKTKQSGDFADDESAPAGDGTPGDGLTYYEEYRGYYVNGEHTYGKPDVKEYFVVNEAGPGAAKGIAMFQSLTKLHVWAELQKTEYDLDSRVLNYLKDRGPSNNEQHVVLIKTGFGSMQHAEAVTVTGRPGTPKDVIAVYVPPAYPSAKRTVSSIISYESVTVAHELLHTVNVSHHGEGDVEAVEWVRDMGTGEVKEGAAAVRAIVERTGQDATAKLNLPDTFGLGIYEGAHSGADDCVMRYDNSSAYKSRITGEGNVRYLAREVAGVNICSSADGTGVNAQTRVPHSRFGNARRGNCAGQIVVNDRGGR